MEPNLHLQAILAQPADVPLGTVSILAKFAREGIETCLLTIPHGEAGRPGSSAGQQTADLIAGLR